MRLTGSIASAPLRGLAAAVALAASLFLIGSQMAQAQDATSRSSITLTGTGSVAAEPDMVEISTGVGSLAPTAREALALNSADMRRIVDALKEQGIPSRDIQTTNFSVQPNYEHPKNGGEPRITGYRVSNSVRIVVRKVDQLGPILDQVVSLGSNEIGGIQFGVTTAEKLRDEARKLAVADARRKAELYTMAAGVELGEVLNISEPGGHQPVFADRRMAMAEASAPPIEGGSLSINASITITWAIR